ncbi:MAG: aldehyde dehydrogenase family protein [Rectinemataceae bacterium]
MKIQGKAELTNLFAEQGANRWKIAATGVRQRVAKLRGLRAAIIERQDELYAALWKDFRKSPTEAWLTEVFPSIEEIDYTVRHLRSWMKDKSVPGAFILPLAKSSLHSEPKGRVLVMSPWNYPFQLTIAPLVSAVAAGNVVIAKPSNKTPSTAAFIASLLDDLFPRNEVAVVEGPGSTLGELLLELPFDHLFFTGSPAVGARVGEAAARMHAGLTLELGGKSPAILLAGADVEDAARKIAWGKCLNAGQTCIAPDYLFCPRESVALFAAAAKRAVERMYGADEAARRESKDFPRIIDSAACDRLRGLVEDAVAKGARIEFGGSFDGDGRYAAPTLFTGARADMAVMDDEIFGPILPVLAYDSLEEAIAFVQSRPKPLALYIFGKDESAIRGLLGRTSSGSVCVNDLIVQIENLRVPFGGVGMSGTGSYHGHYGFKAFSHERNCMRQGPVSLAPLFYPPYGSASRTLLKRALEIIRKSGKARTTE